MEDKKLFAFVYWPTTVSMHNINRGRNQISTLAVLRRDPEEREDRSRIEIHVVFWSEVALGDGRCCLFKRGSGLFISGDQTSEGLLYKSLSYFFTRWESRSPLKRAVALALGLRKTTNTTRIKQQRTWLLKKPLGFFSMLSSSGTCFCYCKSKHFNVWNSCLLATRQPETGLSRL